MTGFDSKREAAADKLQEPPSEWVAIKAILDEYGLQAIDFVANFKAALAQPEQEPVACIGTNGELMWLHKPRVIYSKPIPLYTAPPQREWVGLTEDELLHIGVATGLERAAAQMIEAKLKEKNT